MTSRFSRIAGSLISAGVLAFSVLSTAATAADVIKIGVTPVPHADIVKLIKPALEKEGVELKAVEFNDYIQPNAALADGDLDANFFQTIPYLEEMSRQNGYKFAILTSVHLEPMAVYSDRYKSVKDLPEGARIAVPSAPTNEGRALKVLESAGVIKLKKGATLLATVKDIVENPKKVTFYELEPAQLPRVLPDVAAAVINANYALQAGLNPAKDSIAVEPKSSPFANVVVVRKGEETKPAFAKLKKAINAPEVRTFIEKTYKGGVIPTF